MNGYEQSKPSNCFNCSKKINPEERKCEIDGHVFEETLGKLTSRRDENCPLDKKTEWLNPDGACKMIKNGYVVYRKNWLLRNLDIEIKSLQNSKKYAERMAILPKDEDEDVRLYSKQDVDQIVATALVMYERRCIKVANENLSPGYVGDVEAVLEAVRKGKSYCDVVAERDNKVADKADVQD